MLGMPEEGESKSRRWFRNYLRVSAVVILALLAYTGWIVYWRYREKNGVDAAAAAAQRANKREEAARTFESLGGSEFGILNFYALPAEIRRGETSTICYGVSNAKFVRLEPPADELWPAVSRCFDVAPKKTTTYQLTAEDAAGHTKKASLVITVR
jgi:hypothetical protein